MAKSKLSSDIILGGIVPVIIVALGVAAFVILGSSSPETRDELGLDPRSVLSRLPEATVQQVRSMSEVTDVLDIDLTGSVVPFREIAIAAEVSGRIIYKDPKCRPGTYVTKGTILYRIDPKDYELDVQRLSRLRDQEYASLHELQQEMANAEKLVDLATQEVALQQKEIQRLDSLPSGFASASELDRAKRSMLTTLNQQATIQNQIDLLRARKTRLEFAEQLAATQLEQAKVTLARTEIISPVDGVIVSERAEMDSYVRTGDSLVTIEDTQNVEVACNLRMDQLYWVLNETINPQQESLATASQATRYQLPQTPVSIRYIVSGRERVVYEWQGILDRYESSGIDPQSRTVPCRIRVEKPYEFMVNNTQRMESANSGPPALVRGMFVDISIHTRPSSPLVLVPKLAVKPGNDLWKFQPDDDVLYKPARDAAEEARKKEKEESDESKTIPAAKLVSDKKGAAKTKAQPTTDSPESPAKQDELPVLAEWTAGRLVVLEDIGVVRPMGRLPGNNSDDTEYWICEPEEGLSPGDWVIVTPLAGTQGNGTDPVRVPVLPQTKSQSTTPAT